MRARTNTRQLKKPCALRTDAVIADEAVWRCRCGQAMHNSLQVVEHLGLYARFSQFSRTKDCPVSDVYYDCEIHGAEQP